MTCNWITGSNQSLESLNFLGNLFGLYVFTENRILKPLDDLVSNVIVTVIASIHLS